MNHADLVFDAAPPVFGNFGDRPKILVPEGSEQAVCFGFALIGHYHASDYTTRQLKFNDDGSPLIERRIRVFFEFPDTQTPVFGTDGKPTNETRPATLSFPCTFKMGEGASFRKLLEGMRGKPYSKEEAKAWVAQKCVGMIGYNCMVTVIVTATGTNKIKGATVFPEKFKEHKKARFHEPILFSIENVNAENAEKMKKAFSLLPKWMREDCTQSQEWANAKQFLAPEPPQPAAAPQSQVAQIQRQISPEQQYGSTVVQQRKPIAPVAPPVPQVADEDLPF